jgi:hypothetical protein
MKIVTVLGIAAALALSAPHPAQAAPGCTADGTFTTGNASQAGVWNLRDRGGQIAGELRYFRLGGVQSAVVSGTRSGATLRLVLSAPGAGRVHKALASVTCSKPTAQLRVDKILFVRVAGVGVSHLAFPRVPASDDAHLVAAARAARTVLPAPKTSGLTGWLNAMDAAARR